VSVAQAIAGVAHAQAPANEGSVVKKFLDVAVAFDCAIVTLEGILVVFLQEIDAAKREVRERLPAVAGDGSSEELRSFGKVSIRSSKRSQRKHIAEALRNGRAQVERSGKVFQRNDGLV
jgi:hypothetical protein